MTKAKPIPDGYHTATPYLIADDAAKAIEFYKKAFGASEKLRIPAPGGRIGHADRGGVNGCPETRKKPRR